MWAASAKRAGSWAWSQSALGIIHSAETGPWPSLFTASAGSPVAATRAASRPARTSIQIRAGRNGWPAASSATTLQQVVSSAIAAMSLAASLAVASTWRTDAPSACHQSTGSCSAQLGCGKRVG